ncbi:MAG: ABC transporter permease [archaeon]
MGLFNKEPARAENPFDENHAKVRKVEFNGPFRANNANEVPEEKMGFALRREAQQNIERDEALMYRSQEKLHHKHFYNPMVKLYYIIQKDLKLLIRSKASALIFLFGPLFIMFLVGFAFNTSAISGLTVGVYSDAYSELSENIVTNLNDEQYDVLRLASEEECINAVKFGNAQVCTVLPANMLLDNSNNNEVRIIVDNSRINFANQVSNDIAKKVLSESEEISGNIVLDILTTVDNINQKVATQKTSLDQLKEDNSAIREQFDLIALSDSNFDFDAISEEVDNLKSVTNSSSTAFRKLENLLSGLTVVEAQIQNAQITLENVESTMISDATGLASINVALSSIANDISNIKITNIDNIVSPVQNTIEPISPNNNYLLYILPSLLVLVIMFVSLLISSSTIISEKTCRSHFRNFISPTNDKLFMAGNFTSNLLVILFQLTIIFGVVYFFFNEVPIKSYALSAIVLVMLASFFIFIGMTLGSVFNTKQTVTIAAISLGIVLLFFSSVILPIETLSMPFRSIAMFNPFVLGESIIKKLILFNSGFSGIKSLFLALGGMVLGSLVLALVSRESTKNMNNR